MMFHKWLIGACVAVAAMASSGDAEAQVGALCPSSVQVTNQSSKPVKVTYVWKTNRIEGVVAPKSLGLVCPSSAGETEDSFVSVKVGNSPARKIKISAKQVEKVYERSGFTPDEASLVIDVTVNKQGVVGLRRSYLTKRLPE